MGSASERIFAGHSETGLIAFATLLAVHRVAVDAEQLRDELGHERPVEGVDLLRLAKRLDGVRARRITADFDRLKRLPLPAAANGPDGWFVIGKVSGDEVLVQQPGSNVERLDRAVLDALWSGELLLVTTRESIAGSAGRFDVRWFIPQIVRYRRLIGEVDARSMLPSKAASAVIASSGRPHGDSDAASGKNGHDESAARGFSAADDLRLGMRLARGNRSPFQDARP